MVNSHEHFVQNCIFCRTKYHNSPVAGIISERMGEVRSVSDAEYLLKNLIQNGWSLEDQDG